MTYTQSMPEKPGAVRLMHRLETLQDILLLGPLRRAVRHLSNQPAWPDVPGAYTVSDRTGAIAVCTLTSTELVSPLARLPGVAIAGRVYTANLGIEKIVRNITANPNIRFLVLCGKDSPLFHPGQSLRALWVHGVTSEPGGGYRIISARGYLPVLANIPAGCIDCFRQQVELVDVTGETNPEVIAGKITGLSSPGPFPENCDESEAGPRLGDAEGFRQLRPGGRREHLAYDPNGFFVITLDRKAGEIVVRHYRTDNSPAHLMRGRSAEAILLGLVRNELVSQMSHAGYLGAELSKAETALRLGLRYEQDQPLRPYG